MYYKGQALQLQSIRKFFYATSLPGMSRVGEVVFFGAIVGACYIVGAGAFLAIIATLLLF